MSSTRDRVATVLRVRRVQEMQAAGEMARAAAAAAEAELALTGVRRRYDDHRSLDAVDALVPDRLRDRDTRVLQARAIQRSRQRVQEAVAAVDARRLDLQVRSQAVRAMERLDERLAVEAEAEARRIEIRELDERGAMLAVRHAAGAGR